MSLYYYTKYPAQLLANMLRRVYLDGAYEESFSFSSMKKEIVVAIGTDKSDINLVGTWIIGNQKKGNSGVHVQVFGCLEGPTAE